MDREPNTIANKVININDRIAQREKEERKIWLTGKPGGFTTELLAFLKLSRNKADEAACPPSEVKRYISEVMETIPRTKYLRIKPMNNFFEDLNNELADDMKEVKNRVWEQKKIEYTKVPITTHKTIDDSLIKLETKSVKLKLEDDPNAEGLIFDRDLYSFLMNSRLKAWADLDEGNYSDYVFNFLEGAKEMTYQYFSREPNHYLNLFLGMCNDLGEYYGKKAEALYIKREKLIRLKRNTIDKDEINEASLKGIRAYEEVLKYTDGLEKFDTYMKIVDILNRPSGNLISIIYTKDEFLKKAKGDLELDLKNESWDKEFYGVFRENLEFINRQLTE